VKHGHEEIEFEQAIIGVQSRRFSIARDTH